MTIRIDVDSHFFPKDVYKEVDPRFGVRRPQVWFDAVGRSTITHPDREADMSYHQRHGVLNMFQWHWQRPGFWEPELRLEILDKLGINMQVLVPSGDLFSYNVEPELAANVCRSYNKAISGVLQRFPGRFIGLTELPMQSPPLALEELDRAVTEFGLNAVIMLTNVDGRNLDEPDLWPVYARIEELGVPLILHPSRGGKLLGLDRLTKFHFDNALGFLYEGSLAISSLITGGVLDLFPRLRVGLLETGCGYLPYLMDRLNEVYETEGLDKLIKKRPQEYLDQLWLSANVQTERETLAYVVQRYGGNRLMMATDFPHGLGGAGETVIDAVLQNPGLTEDQKELILGGNAAELFGIPSETPVKQTEKVGAGHFNR